MSPVPHIIRSTRMDCGAHLLQVGEFAWSCLASGRQGRVLASFSKALYLTTEAGELFWLADPQVPMHRRCASLNGALPNVAADTRYVVHGEGLMIAPDHEIELGRPQVWHTPMPARAAPAEVIAAGVNHLIRNIGVAAGPGFVILLPRILSALGVEVALQVTEIGDALLRRAEPLVLGLARAYMSGNSQKTREMADGLIGLGPGLTPSGDDFLGGLLFALRAWEIAFPAVESRSGWISTERYAGRTHLISFTLLDDMAKGSAIAPMHDLVNGLISGESPNDIHSHVTDLIGVGHSTGWDLLTGLLTGLLSGIRAQEG